MECEFDGFSLFHMTSANFTNQRFIFRVKTFVTFFPLLSNSSGAIASTKNSFTVELLIGFAWDC